DVVAGHHPPRPAARPGGSVRDRRFHPRDQSARRSHVSLHRPAGRSPMRWRRLNLIIGGSIVGTVVVAALVSYAWTPFDPERVSATERLLGVGDNGHLLGTDQFGRDVFSQIMVGSQTALFVGILAVSIAVAVGIPLGGVAAARRGWV